MTRPVLKVDTLFSPNEEPVVGTIMEHNEPPSMLVMITELPSSHPNTFAGTCLNDGMHIPDDGWELSEFHIFKGSVTLSQGV